MYSYGHSTPVLMKVEEYGVTRLVLMQKAWWTHTEPPRRELVVEPGADVDLVFTYRHIPAVTTGRSWWERA